MIREFRVKNFRSIAEEQVLSFEATKDELGDGFQVKTMLDGTRLLRFAVIYGANASGKTNVLNALEFVLDFIKGDENVKKDDGISNFIAPFKFLKEYENKDSEFTLVFYENEKKFTYELKVNSKTVSSEKLLVYNSQKPTKYFERTFENGEDIIEFNASLKIDDRLKQDFKRYTLRNTSIFNTLLHVNTDIEDLEKISEHLRRVCDRKVESIVDNPEKKSYVLNLIKEADYNITDIDVEKEKIPDKFIDQMMSSKNVPPSLIEKIKKDSFNTRVFFEHYAIDKDGNKVHAKIEDDDESKGTRSTIGFGLLMYDVLKNNIFLSDDEFEKSFHPEIMKKLIFSFLNVSDSTSQLLVTSHYDPLMDEIDKGNLRPDSFWFTDKKEDASTELYSLIEFNGINSIRSIREAYRSGQLGALPCVM
jgi:AAA15 family ATPase/GTPase